ncbi:MAG: hypothetical protein ACP5F1_01850 [Thermoplasmata archaeon]|nr:hypothetical protein [Thermoplasmata archaeon]
MKNINIFKNTEFNIILILAYIAIMLAISPLIPGVTWFQLGDFTLDVVNYYHTLMIPLALLLILYATYIMKLNQKILTAINASTIPLIILNILGLIFFYPSNTQLIDYILQGMRDVWMLLLTLLFFIGLLLFPFKFRDSFKKIWGAYFLILLATISAGIAAIMGMIYEYGSLYGYSSIPIFNSMVNSWGGLQTFLGNLVTSHSHEMLPAVMGGIVALAALSFGYGNLNGWKRNIINVGMVISIFGTISMTYLYIISSFGTYSIPAIFTSGPYGMNGLALDDSQTGLIGIGALISSIGIYFTLSNKKTVRLLQISELITWIATMFVMVGIGYIIEFNESYYGFATAGTPPNGGPGYLYDMAYTNGHLMFAFFFMPVLAALLLAFLIFTKENSNFVNFNAYLFLLGTALGAEGVLIYLITLSWYVEAIGLAIIAFSMLLMLYPSIKIYYKNLKENS